MDEQIKSIVDKLKTLPIEQVQKIISELIPILGEEEKKNLFEEVAKLLGLDVDYNEEISEKESENNGDKPAEESGESNINNNTNDNQQTDNQKGPTQEQANAMLAQFM